MDDLALPASRLPGVEAVAREVLGLDPWDPLKRNWTGAGFTRVVPLTIPAGRLVAETWLPAQSAYWAMRWDDDADERAVAADLHANCLWAGDLLRLCSALGVEVPAGTVPRMERAKTGAAVWVFGCEPGSRWYFVAADPVEGETLLPALAGITDPRAALDAIVAAVVPHV